MPTTCHGWPLRVMVSPTSDARPPKRVCHSSWLMMQTAGPLGRSSSAVKLRPTAGRMPSVGRNEALTRRPFSCSGSPLPVSVKLSNAEIADRRERARVFSNLLVARPRQRGRVQVELRVVGPDRDQRRGIRNRDRVEDEPIVDGEQRRVRADADRDGQHGDDRERRALPERADGLLEIRHQQVSRLNSQGSGAQA